MPPEYLISKNVNIPKITKNVAKMNIIRRKSKMHKRHFLNTYIMKFRIFNCSNL